MVRIQRAELSVRNRLEQELDMLREEVRQLRAHHDNAELTTSVPPKVNVSSPTKTN